MPHPAQSHTRPAKRLAWLAALDLSDDLVRPELRNGAITAARTRHAVRAAETTRSALGQRPASAWSSPEERRPGHASFPDGR